MTALFKNIKKKAAIHFGKEPKAEAVTADGSITYYDWEYNADADAQWFTKFIEHHFPQRQQKLNFYGVFGKGKFVHNPALAKKIFFSMENLDKKHTGWNRKFGNYCLPHVDLAMGFGDIKNEKYVRFPLWIQYLFPPTANKQEVVAVINRINETRYDKTKECALIAGHDKHGTRTMVYEGIKDILQIDSAGRWNNNSQELWQDYDNNKIAYLRQFKFNICPENINTNLYVTEKLFEAFLADAIPIYHGSDNMPEPGIVNPEAVIFWNPRGSNQIAREQIMRLKEDPSFYKEFMARPKLLPAAAEYVWSRYEELEQRLGALLTEM